MQSEAKMGSSKMAPRGDFWKHGEGWCGGGALERGLVEARWVSWASLPALEGEAFGSLHVLPPAASALG